MENMVITNMKG
ncbi:hypothetical protein CLOSBL3_10423 [Clostridiaceae bacterium BL-3]|nr:hypothetical protein CLOSBL3_10423 [Clostridiaceae bacterium BL-3]